MILHFTNQFLIIILYYTIYLILEMLRKLLYAYSRNLLVHSFQKQSLKKDLMKSPVRV